MAADHLMIRYLPGLVAVAGGVALIICAPRRHRIKFTISATLLGLTAMEAEYWVAHGFPSEEVSFYVVTVVITISTLFLGAFGGLALGVAGLCFFAYVNIRYGAPYLLDYVLPVLYAYLVMSARRELPWKGTGLFATGRPEALWLIAVNVATIWRTTVLDKWGWITGRPW